MRVKRGSNRVQRRKKVLKLAKGYFLTGHNAYRMAKLSVDKGLLYAYRDRRARKREMRRLWIIRINAAARMHDLTYSQLMAGLKAAGCEIDRKQLAEMAARDAAGFGDLVKLAKKALPASAA